MVRDAVVQTQSTCPLAPFVTGASRACGHCEWVNNCLPQNIAPPQREAFCLTVMILFMWPNL